MEFRRRLYQVLQRLAFNVDITGPNQDWAPYPVLVVPMLPIADDTLAGKLLRYVEAGGTLVWHPFSGMKDADARIYPARLHPALAELAGAALQEFASLGGDETAAFDWDGRTWQAGHFCDLASPAAGAEVAGRYAAGRWFAGAPAVIRNPRGRGACWYVTTFAENAFYEAFLERRLAEAGVRPILPGPIPEHVEVCERRTDDGRRLVFVINHGPAARRLETPAPMRDLYHGEAPAQEFMLAPHGVRVLSDP